MGEKTKVSQIFPKGKCEVFFISEIQKFRKLRQSGWVVCLAAGSKVGGGWGDLGNCQMDTTSCSSMRMSSNANEQSLDEERGI